MSGIRISTHLLLTIFTTYDMLTKLIVKYLATLGIIKRIFTPWAEGELESRDWSGDTGTVVADTIFIDRSKGYWYLWVHDSDQNMWRLYRFSHYAFWKAIMACCDAFIVYNETDGDVSEDKIKALETIDRRICSIPYKVINEIAA